MSYKYMRDGLADDYGFLELQDKILEIAVYVDKVCRDNNIDYCLMGGSALGAKRHGGFIPWDDDLDIFMTPDNYERFREVFRSSGDKENFYLQEWGLTDGMVTIAKVRMNNTTYIEGLIEDWDIHQGIFMDIFILHTCPDSKFLRTRQYFWAKYVILKGLSLRNYTKRGGFAGFAVKCAGLLPDKFLIRHALKQIYKYRNKKTAYYCNFLGKATLKNGTYKHEYFAETEYAGFEKTELRVPAKLHEFLSDRFGDYMKPPSPERIKWEQHAKKWDINKDFRDYVKNIKTFSDENKLI